MVDDRTENHKEHSGHEGLRSEMRSKWRGTTLVVLAMFVVDKYRAVHRPHFPVSNLIVKQSRRTAQITAFGGTGDG
jgi:hypothetical protein